MDGIIHQVNLEKMKYEKVEGYELAFRYEMLLNELEVWGVSNTHTHTHTIQLQEESLEMPSLS